SGCIGGRLSLSHGVEGIARVLKCPLWASCRVRVEVRGDINSTLLQKPMDVSQFWRRYWMYISSFVYDPEGKTIFSETNEKDKSSICFVAEKTMDHTSRLTLELYFQPNIRHYRR